MRLHSSLPSQNQLAMFPVEMAHWCPVRSGDWRISSAASQVADRKPMRVCNSPVPDRAQSVIRCYFESVVDDQVIA